MIKDDTLLALNDGYDVILEGILSVKSYSKVLEEIFEAHPDNNFMYYFDISFEETLRRHATRKTTRGSGFGEEDIASGTHYLANRIYRLERIIAWNPFGSQILSIRYCQTLAYNHKVHVYAGNKATS